MKKEFTPIAMRCNKEQFEAIKPKLEKEGLIIKHLDSFKKFPYLVNNLSELDIISNVKASASKYNRDVHETWDEKVFLEACGIETEQEYTITKSQLLELKNGYKTEKLREWFPEAFETVLEVGKWIFVDRAYQSEEKALVFYQGVETPTYGFTHAGNWSDHYGNGDDTFSNPKYKYTYPTESEVFEALKNEAVKRYKVGDYIKNHQGTHELEKLNLVYSKIYNNGIYNKQGSGLWLFINGVWSDVIPTLTRKEAENKLGVKIVD